MSKRQLGEREDGAEQDRFTKGLRRWTSLKGALKRRNLDDELSQGESKFFSQFILFANCL